MTGEDFDDVRDALDALAEGRISPERVREEYGHVDDIDYSISVAIAQREQDVDDDEEWQETFSADFEFDEDDGIDWPEASEDEERERLAALPDDELRSELGRIEDENEEWRGEYDVESPEELRETISEAMDADERERRLEDEYDWKHNLYTRELILDVLDTDWPYDIYEKTGDDADPRAQEVIDRMMERARQDCPPEPIDEGVSEVLSEHDEDDVRECARIILHARGTFRMAGRDVFDSTYAGVVVGTSVTACLSRVQDS